MKIVVLGTRGFPNVQGGVEAHCQNLYPRLVKLGHQVIVLGREPYLRDSPLSKANKLALAGTVPTTYQGVEIIPLASPKHKALEAFVHTFLGVLEARKLKPDVLHIHAVGPALFVPLARMLGMRVVMTHHGPDYERAKWGRLAKMVLRLGEAWGVKAANEVICVSSSVAERLEKKFGRKVHYIPNGVEVFRDSPLSKANKLALAGTVPSTYVLAVGRFVPEKGFHDLLGTVPFADVQGSSGGDSPYNIVIVGDADHEDAYSKALKEKAAKTPGVVLTGRLTGQPLQEMFAHASLFVLPSYYEGLPIVLLEAMSYGLSCVVSDIPANREVGLEEERYFKPGDVDALRRKIADFLARPLDEGARQALRDKVAREYNWDTIAKQTGDVLCA